MSDTPRTDALREGIKQRNILRGFNMPEDHHDALELAGDLERALAISEQACKKLGAKPAEFTEWLSTYKSGDTFNVGDLAATWYAARRASKIIPVGGDCPHYINRDINPCKICEDKEASVLVIAVLKDKIATSEKAREVAELWAARPDIDGLHRCNTCRSPFFITHGECPYCRLEAAEQARKVAEDEVCRLKDFNNKTIGERDGKFLDPLGCCKVCDGEIPDGHADNCYIWKLEKKHKDFISNEYNAVLYRAESAEQRAAALQAACIKQSQVFSRIDYVCEPPNEMELSGYDVHCDEDAVLQHVISRFSALQTELNNKQVRIDAALTARTEWGERE